VTPYILNRRIAEILQSALAARTLHELVPGSGYNLAMLHC
jgi:hypothetical protein